MLKFFREISLPSDLFKRIAPLPETTALIPVSSLFELICVTSAVVSLLEIVISIAEAVELVEMGKGSLVTSFISNNDKKSKEFVVETAHTNGRILVLNSRCSKESTGHGSPMPQLVHGGPGRAGGGEEMGGIRGIKHYLQRTSSCM